MGGKPTHPHPPPPLSRSHAPLSYLVISFRPSFVLTVTPKVSGATVINSVLPGVAGQGPPFSQDIQQVVAFGDEKAHGASGGRRHCVTPGGPKRKQRRPKNSLVRQKKRSVWECTERLPEGRFSGGGVGHRRRHGIVCEQLPSQLVRHCCVPLAYPDDRTTSAAKDGNRRDASIHLQDGSSVTRALDLRGPPVRVPQQSHRDNPSRVYCWDTRARNNERTGR